MFTQQRHAIESQVHQMSSTQLIAFGALWLGIVRLTGEQET